jgi:signal transduction histidine kinase
VAVVAWQAANRQRQDGEGALRQAASDAAARTLKSITESDYRELMQPNLYETVPRSPRFHSPIRQSWFTRSGDPHDWIFGPWPQDESQLSAAFNAALALHHAGKTAESRDALTAPDSPFSRCGPLAPSTTYLALTPTASSKPPMGRTAAGLPLGPLFLRHLMETATDEKERRTKAVDLLEAAVIHPSLLTPSLVEEAASALAKKQTAEETEAIERARDATRRLETLRRLLKEHRQEVIDGKPWIEGEWNLAYKGIPFTRERINFVSLESFVVVLSRGELADWLFRYGIGSAVPGLPEGWTFRARRDGVAVTNEVLNATVMASKDSEHWGIDVVSANPSVAFAALDNQLTRQRWLIGGSTTLMSLALGGFLYVLARQRRLNAMMSNFVASVSHELRAPVASMGLLAERLGDGRISGEEEQRRYHKLLCGEFRRISATIENVLAFSRRERGRHVYEHELSDLTALLQDAVEIVRPLADERGVSLSVNLPERDVERELDPIAIRQAVLNLLDNALKFSPRGGTIHLTLREENGEALITVRDEGPGVPLDERSRIFEPFYRIGSELRRETPGVGIGLSIVRDAAVAHRGSVSVNGSPGTGAEFILRIARSSSDF